MEVLEPKQKIKSKPLHSLFKLNDFPSEGIRYRAATGRANINSKESYYHTNFDIVVDGKIIQSNRGVVCFSYLTGAGSEESRELYLINPEHKNKQVVAYALSEDINLKASEIRKWVNLMRMLNLPFKFKELYAYSLNYNSFNKTSPITNYSYAKQKVYAIVINYDDYTSVEQFKILLYLFRYIYEGNLFEVVRNVIKYKETYKGEFDFIKAFFFIDGFTKRSSHSHYINRYLFTDITTEKFLQYINTFDDSKTKYSNVLMEVINKYFEYYNVSVEYMSKYGYKTSASYNNFTYDGLHKDYKKLDFTKSIEDNLEALVDIIKTDDKSLYIVKVNDAKILSITVTKQKATKSSKFADLNEDEDEDDDDEY